MEEIRPSLFDESLIDQDLKKEHLDQALIALQNAARAYEAAGGFVKIRRTEDAPSSDGYAGFRRSTDEADAARREANGKAKRRAAGKAARKARRK